MLSKTGSKMYKLSLSKQFIKSLKKLLDSRRVSKLLIEKTFDFLAADPFDKKLKTHKVNTKNLGVQYSSRVDGDLRIIWNFDQDQKINIMLLDIGGHEGNKKVYK